MIIYAFILIFSLISSVRGSIYVQAPNHVPKSYLETLIRKFAKPLQDIQELTGEGVQLEFSIRSPEKTPKETDQSDEKSSENPLRRSLIGKMMKKRGPPRLRPVSNKRHPPVRILSQQPSHLHTIKPRGRPAIKQPSKPPKRPPFRLNKLPNKPSLHFKPVNKQRNGLYLNPQSQHGHALPEKHSPPQRVHQEIQAVTSHTVVPSYQTPPPPPLPTLSASSVSHAAIIPDKKAIDLEDINKAFVDMEKRLSSGLVNRSDTGGKNLLNNDLLNRTLQIFEKRILDSIGAPRQRESKEPHLEHKQREVLLCDDAKMLQEALKPVLFEDLWQYLGKRKCEEEYSSSVASPKIDQGTRKSMQITEILNDNDHEDYTNENIFIHTGDNSEPIKIPLANVYSRLIY